jgi:hypothetical protein
VSDSTTNTNTGTNHANTSAQSTFGQIANALSYASANSDTTTVQDSASLEITGQISFSAWIKTTDASSSNLWRSYQNSSPYNGYGIGYGISGVGKISYWSSAHGSWVVSNSSVNDGVWHYVVVTISSGGSVTFYRDGIADGTQTSSVPATYTGGREIAGAGFTGALDELRVSNLTRSADWVVATYNNQSQSSTFSSVGSDDSSAPNIASLSPSSGLIGTSTTITGTNFGSTQSSSTIKFNGTIATVTSWSATSITATVPSGAGPGYAVVTVSSIPSNGIKFRVTNGYSYFRAITIDHTKVPNTDQANFPVLISGSYPYLATTANGGNVTNANGYDIIFSPDAAGTSILDFEQESYNPTTGAINYWVRVPTVSHSTDTIIYIFYGNSAVSMDQSNKGGVWDSNYALVSHLSDNAANMVVADSTSNANNLNNRVSTSNKTATGEISNGLTYDGSSDYSSVANNSSVDIQGSAITLEVWAKPTNSTAASSERLIVKEVSGNADPYVRYGLFRASSGSSQITFFITTGGPGSYTSASGGSTSAGSWTHAVGVYNGTTMTLYVNGSSVATASKTGSIASSSTPLVFGADTEISSEYFNGVLDEARISNSARSADWIAAEYNNQSWEWNCGQPQNC